MRRGLGTLAFLAVAASIFAIAYSAVSESGDDSRSVASQSTFATTTPPIPPAGPFKVTDGVNVRTGPGTSFPRVATVDLGKEVMVVCVIEGGIVEGPNWSTTKWVRITAGSVIGYVSSGFVATGAAIGNPAVIPVCAAV